MLAALSFIPPWVPVLFLALVLLGWRHSRSRAVRPGSLVVLALAMCGLSLYGVIAAFGASVLAVALWLAAYAGVALVGAGRVAAGGLVAVGRQVRLPGSWVPMALMLGIFAAKFGLGFAAGTHSPVLHWAGFAAAMSFVLGALSGGFGARALAVHRVASAAGQR